MACRLSGAMALFRSLIEPLGTHNIQIESKYNDQLLLKKMNMNGGYFITAPMW